MGLKIIAAGRASGKTTAALRQLDEMGGGVFVTRHEGQTRAIAKHMEPPLKNLDKILIMNLGLRNLVVDDADHLDTVLVRNIGTGDFIPATKLHM